MPRRPLPQSARRVRAYISEQAPLPGKQFDEACAAGSVFLVFPGCDPSLFDLFKTASVPLFPGIATPCEVLSAFDHGYRVQNFLPANANDGTAARLFRI